MIPKTKVVELADWIMSKLDDKKLKVIIDKGKYKSSIIKKIKNNEFEGVNKYYEGMLQYKYGILDPSVYYDKDSKSYIDVVMRKA